MRKFIDKYYPYIIGILFLAAIATRFYGIKHPDWKVFDEIYYTEFAQKHLTRGEYFDVHPPLGKLFIAGGIKTFGDNPLGWRVSEAVFGILIIVLIFLLSYKIFKNKYLALIGLILAVCSLMLLVESRLSLINIFLAFFVLLTVYLFFLWCDKSKNWLLFLSVISFSFALLVKWTAVYIFPAILLYLLIDKNLRSQFYQQFIIKWYNLIILFILVLAVYLGIFYLTDISQFNLIEWHKQAFDFHKNLTQTHPYASKWYTWLLMIRPLCVEYKDTGDGNLIGILQIGNLAIFWTGIVAIIYAIIRVFKNDQNRNILIFLITSIFMFLIPWVFIKRISFIYLFLPAVPFLIILVSWFIYKIYQYGLKFKILAIFLILLAIAWFTYFYPIVAGIPTTSEKYHQRMWLKSWI